MKISDKQRLDFLLKSNVVRLEAGDAGWWCESYLMDRADPEFTQWGRTPRQAIDRAIKKYRKGEL